MPRPMRTGQQPLPLLALAFLLLLLSGCSSTLPARVSLKGKRVLVIPFAQSPAREFDSTLGRELAANVSALASVAVPKALGVVDFRDAERLMPRSRTESVDWIRLAQAMKADFVLLGEIQDYRLREPKNLTTRQGTLVVSYRVLDVAKGVNLVVVPARAFLFPPVQDSEFSIGEDLFTKSDVIAAGLMATASRGIAAEFQERVVEK